MRRPTRFLALVLALGASALAAGLATAEPPAAIDRAPVQESLAQLKAKYHRPSSAPFPPDNAYTAARAELGRALFFDPRLSASGVIACATCHNPGFSWGDALPRGVGHASKTLRRRSPTLLNVAWAEALFWDGRAQT